MSNVYNTSPLINIGFDDVLPEEHTLPMALIFSITMELLLLSVAVPPVPAVEVVYHKH